MAVLPSAQGVGTDAPVMMPDHPEGCNRDVEKIKRLHAETEARLLVAGANYRVCRTFDAKGSTRGEIETAGAKDRRALDPPGLHR